MKRTIKTLVAAGVVGSAAVVAGAYFGLVNVGADDPHFPAVYAFLSMARDRSIEVRSQDIQVPNLNGEAMIRAGAGNYNSMCIGCHLAPGIAETELSQSLYPAPPNLTKVGVDGNPAATFWVIKHGIKATGMPAWGKSMGDQYIWGMVAFLNELPKLNAEQYRALVASSGGHEHGGGETQMHNHEGQHESASPDHHASDSSAVNANADHHGDAAGGADHQSSNTAEPANGADHHAADSSKAKSGAGHHDTGHAHEEKAPVAAPKTHTHADGKEHVHES
ncbi:c-type cytochrome [Pseudomonas rhizophila]